MKIGDLIRIKDPFDYDIDWYPDHLVDEVMLVTDIIDELVATDSGEHCVAINGVAVCVSAVGENRFPVVDMEVVNESR
jgi:hypothetical protein